MQKVFLRLVIILTIIILILVIIQNDSIKGYYRSIFLKKIEALNKDNFKIDYNELDISYIRIVLKKVNISDNGVLAYFDNITIRPEFFSLLFIKPIFSINCYYGDINIDFNSMKSQENLSLAGKIKFFKTDFLLKNIKYNGKLLDISEKEVFGKVEISSDIEFELKNSNFYLNGIIDNDYFDIELEVKNADIKKYSEFLKDFSNIDFIKGVFDIDINIIKEKNNIVVKGQLNFNDISVKIQDIPYEITNIKGEVKIDGDKRIFNDVNFEIAGFDFILKGERIRKTYTDFTIEQKTNNKNFLRIYGEDNNILIDANFKFGKVELNLKKENIYKLNLSYGDIKGILFLENNKNKGNFRIQLPFNTNFWGDYFLDEKNNLNFDKCFFRLYENIHNVRIVKTEEMFKLIIPEIFELMYSINTKKIDIILENNMLDEKISGVFNDDFKFLSLRKKDSNDFINIDLRNNTIESKYKLYIKGFSKKNFNISDVFLNLNFLNNKFEFSGKCGKIEIIDFKRENVVFKGIYEKDKFIMDFENTIVTLKFDKDKIIGSFKDIDINIPYSKNNINIKSSKINFTNINDKYVFEPEDLNLNFNDYNLNMIDGKFIFMDEKLFSENVIFKILDDTVEIQAEYFQKVLSYSGRILGNTSYEYMGFKIKNKVARFTGVDNNISGYIILDKAHYKDIPDWNISGKVEFNSKDLSFKDLEFINSNAVFYASGWFDYNSMKDFSIKVNSKKPHLMKFNTEKFNFESVVFGNLNIDANKGKYKIGGELDFENTILKILYLSDKKLPFEFENVKLNIKKAEIHYKSHKFIMSGNINMNTKDIDKIDLRIDGGYIDILGNKFSIMRGNVSTTDIFSNIERKILNIYENRKKLETEYKVNATIDNDKVYDFEGIKKNIWYDLTLKKDFSNLTVYSSVKGKGEDVSFVLYSEPEKTQDEIYNVLKENSIFGFLDSKDPKEKFLELLGIQKTFIKSFTKKFNFDSVDLKKDNDEYNIFLKKRFNENIFLNYEKALKNEDETYGIEYRFNERMKIESTNSQDESSLRLKWKINF
ncbi:MAG: translocation/assembly module TamB [Candidatus Muirbacterium halophilum]|nr:translocation/assembly module TamB [Candidatus Muirbacterium halophilum]